MFMKLKTDAKKIVYTFHLFLLYKDYRGILYEFLFGNLQLFHHEVE